MYIILGILLPFIGTTIGSLMVFFMNETLNKKIEKLLLGFSAGVMIAASIWSLLIPSIESAQDLGFIKWVPATVGFIIGIAVLIIIDRILIKVDEKNKKMLFLAVTIHNIPEGMAVGVIFAGLISGGIGITMASAFSLAIGIAIQNFPEGAIISMPLKSNNEMSKTKAFIYGVLSGIVEPIFAIITLLFTNIVIPILPYILSFAAGAMFYVVINELLTEEDKLRISTIGFTIGFLLMMILDI